MLQPLFRKWWVVFIQGVLLILLSIFIFNNSKAVLAGISFWFGILVLVAGLLGIINLLINKEERRSMSLVWSILTFIFGLIILTHLVAAMATLSVVFGFWVLVSGILLVRNGWSLKSESSIGWIMVVGGILSIIAALLMIFNMAMGAIAISTILGFQVLFTGISLILLSTAKRMVKAKAL
jgi:uncharacterized membrane protein HdeD (DUF308 family)